MTDYSRKITQEDATEIRSAWWNTSTTQAALARSFRISRSQVWQIIHRRSWPFGPRVVGEPSPPWRG